MATPPKRAGRPRFSVVLNSQPTADVTIGLSSSDPTEGTLSVSSLVFTSANWNTPQVVTVTGVDDAVDDGDLSYTILTAAAGSTDALYSGRNAADVAVTNTDDDTAGIAVSAISGNTSEAGGAATLQCGAQQPADRATSRLPCLPATRRKAHSAYRALVFTSANWNTPQVVTVTGVDDAVDDGDLSYTILTAAAGSTDALYSGLDAADVAVTNTDDDTAGIAVSAISGNTSEAGGTATLQRGAQQPADGRRDDGPVFQRPDGRHAQRIESGVHVRQLEHSPGGDGHRCGRRGR